MIKLTPVFASLAFIAAAPVTAHAADLYALIIRTGQAPGRPS